MERSTLDVLKPLRALLVMRGGDPDAIEAKVDAMPGCGMDRDFHKIAALYQGLKTVTAEDRQRRGYSHCGLTMCQELEVMECCIVALGEGEQIDRIYALEKERVEKAGELTSHCGLTIHQMYQACDRWLAANTDTTGAKATPATPKSAAPATTTPAPGKPAAPAAASEPAPKPATGKKPTRAELVAQFEAITDPVARGKFFKAHEREMFGRN